MVKLIEKPACSSTLSIVEIAYKQGTSLVCMCDVDVMVVLV